MVDTRPGANGVIGTELAAKSPADGYTLVLGNSATHGILPNLGLQPVSNTPDEFRALIKLEIEKWGKVVKAANIKTD